MSSPPNQPYYMINPINLDMNFKDLMFSREYNYRQDYSMGHGLGHGSALGSAHGLVQGSVLFHDDKDDSPVEEVLLVKPKKPSRHSAKAKKDEPKEVKETPKEWIVEEEIALCQGWYFENETGSTRGYDSIVSKWKNRVRPRIGAFYAIIKNIEANHESGTNDLDVYQKASAKYKMMYKGDFTLEHCYNVLKDHPGWKNVEMPNFYQSRGRKKSKTSKTTSGSVSGGLKLNEEADEDVEESQEFRPMGCDRANAKKKAVGSSRGGASSFVDLVADKFYNMKQQMGKEGQGTTVLYRVKELRVEYPGGRGSRNCTAEKGETRNSASNA
ncbi:retrotransposon protein, putative, ty3-gypsy subclass [Tanacetum coccineum]|uniref:Retrotransposon protein, putative, ty3-gypsy subclass n=1 Tax=Tanacetum coccineum TaxID=301880 RepID=A0ABQ4Y795_9ASTR